MFRVKDGKSCKKRSNILGQKRIDTREGANGTNCVAAEVILERVSLTVIDASTAEQEMRENCLEEGVEIRRRHRVNGQRDLLSQQLVRAIR